MPKTALIACGALLALGLAPAQAATVTYTINGVASAEGRVRGALCTDAQHFPGGDCPYRAEVAAETGSVKLVFPNIPDGDYAFSAFHDANDNGRVDIPTEGYAFGNNVGFPPAFKAAALHIAGDTQDKVDLTYMVRPGPSASAGEVGVPAPAGIDKTDLRQAGLYGALYAPKGAKKLPVIVALGGSEGGLDAISALTVGFTRRGYAVLALAYWRAPGLPQTLENVRLEYFEQGIGWLKTRPEIDSRRIGVLGWSRGAEAALLVASHDQDVKAVIAVAPTANLWIGMNPTGDAAPQPAWTEGGHPLPFATPVRSPVASGALKDMFSRVLDAGPDAETEIPVEKINGPVLLLTGSEDAIWPSSRMAEQVVARLKGRSFAFDYRHVDYSGAGHMIFTGGGQADGHLSAAARAFMGGSDEANARARVASWSLALDFTDKALKGEAR